MRFLLGKALPALFLSYISFAFSLNAQTNKTSYKLLWKISGNGLTKPSYLFGTMHIKDKRVFDFSDSVLAKISECSGFALEVHPDTLIKSLYQNSLNKKIKKEYSTSYYKERLSKEEYAKLNDQVKEETGNSLEDIPNQSPSAINYLLKRFVKSKAEKNTFLDAYLYYLARVQGKKILGIEKINEHVKDLDSAKNEIQFNEIQKKLTNDRESVLLEKLISIYQTGDIEKIFNFSFPEEDSYYLKELTQRNITMARRIDSLVKNQNVFFAVGCAHLAGESGLIKLLKSKGYILTPVKSAFTGVASKFIVNSEKDPWKLFDPASHLYTVELPSTPYETSNGMNMYNDIGTGITYFMTGFSSMENFNSQENRENALKRVLYHLSYVKRNKILSEKKITYEGKNGYEIYFSDISKSYSCKLRILFNENIQYSLFACGEGINYVEHKDVLRFFNSFKIKSILPNEWKMVTNEKGAFSIKMPTPVRIDSIISEKANVYTFSGQNASDGKYYGLVYSKFKPGKYIANDSVYFDKVLTTTTKNVNGKVRSKSFTEIEGIPCMEFSISIKNSSLFYGKVFLRGNRPYVLIMTTTENDFSSIDKKTFYDSFAFTPFLKSNWRTYFPEDKSFSVLFPATPIVKKDSTESMGSESISTNLYFINDPSTDSPFILNVNTASPYLHYKNIDSLYTVIRKNIVEEGDTIRYEKRSGTVTEPVIEWVINSKGNQLEERKKIMVKKNKIYELYTYQTSKEIFSPEVNSYFNSLKINDSAGNGNLFSDKTNSLLSDLSSPDTTISQIALNSLNWYNFSKDDTKPVLEALYKKYPDDTTQYGGIRQKILSKTDFFDEETTISLISKIYPELPKTGGLQKTTLQRLIKLGSKKSLLKVVDLLLENSMKDSIQGLYSYLGDSIVNSKILYPKIYRLLDQKNLHFFVYSLTNQALDSNIISKNDLLPIKDQLLSEANTILLENKSSDQSYEDNYRLSQLIDLLSHFPEDNEFVKLLRIAVEHKENSIQWQAVQKLITGGYAVESKYINKLAADSYMRSDVYQWLKEKNKLSLFPKVYLRQELFAESALLSVITEDSEAPSQIKLIEKRIVTYHDKKGIAYLFKFEQVDQDGKSEWYTGMSGLYPVDKNEMIGNWELSYSKYETLSSKNIDEHFNTYLTDPVEKDNEENEQEE